MQGIKFRILLIFFAHCVCSSTAKYAHPDPNNGEIDYYREDEVRKCNSVEKMKERLENLAHYTLKQMYESNLDCIHDRGRCDCEALYSAKNSFRDSTLTPDSEKFIEDFLKKIDEAVQEYRSFDKDSSYSKEEYSQDAGDFGFYCESLKDHISSRSGQGQIIFKERDYYEWFSKVFKVSFMLGFVAGCLFLFVIFVFIYIWAM